MQTNGSAATQLQRTDDIETAVAKNQKIIFSETGLPKRTFFGRLYYFWCAVAVCFMVGFIATPILVVLRILNRPLWFYPFARWGAQTWVKVCGARVEVKGLERLDPNRGYIFVSNHRSYIDTATLFGHVGRRIGLVAKKELLKVPVFGWGMGFVNIIAIDRSNPERAVQSMEKARKVVENGYSFGVFAEGTRAMPGELLPFKKGAFHLALQTGAAIVPMAIKNTDILMGKRTGVARPGVIEVELLEPIEVAGRSEEDMNELINLTRGAVARSLAEQVYADE